MKAFGAEGSGVGNPCEVFLLGSGEGLREVVDAVGEVEGKGRGGGVIEARLPKTAAEIFAEVEGFVLFIGGQGVPRFLAVDPMREGAAHREDLAFRSGGLEGFEGKEPLGGAEGMTEGIGGTAREVVRLVHYEAGARRVKAVALFKYVSARGVEAVIEVPDPDLRIGQATFGQGVGTDSGLATEGFCRFQFKGPGLEKMFRAKVGLVPTGGEFRFATGITGAGMGGAFDAVLAAVAHLDGAQAGAEHRLKLHAGLDLSGRLAAEKDEAFMDAIEEGLEGVLEDQPGLAESGGGLQEEGWGFEGGGLQGGSEFGLPLAEGFEGRFEFGVQ